MNHEKLQDARELYDKIYEVLQLPATRIILLEKYPSLTDVLPNRIFWLDSLEFMTYISDADGYISKREVNIMNYITNEYMSVDTIQQLAYDSEDMDTRVPVTVMLLCELENYLYKNNAAQNYSIMNAIIAYFKTIGELVADTDNGISSEEYSRINEYIDRIQEYAEENTLSPFFNY